MSRDRYVLLGLGRSRSSWFANLAHWATSGAIPAEFHKCLSATHVRQRLNGLQPHSALIVEDGIAEVDRDLIEAARRAHTPVLIISSSNDPQTWMELGAVAVLPSDLTPATLLQALVAHAQLIGPTNIDELKAGIDHLTERQGRLIAVCGSGGTGTSTVAIAIAQAIGSNVTATDHVLLADFARNNEQGMLHNSPDVMPGVEEVVELHRHGKPTTFQLRDLTFSVEQRGYRLLLGQRRIDSWTALPPGAVSAAISGLRRTFETVIADLTADFEGEADGGSIDVEERNALARTTVLQADLVFVVGMSGLKGIHSLVRTMRQVVATGVDESHVVPVINRTQGRTLERTETTRTITTLVTRGVPSLTPNAPIFLPDRPIDNALRDGTRLDKHIVGPLGIAVKTLSESPSRSTTSFDTPQRISPGSLSGQIHRT